MFPFFLALALTTTPVAADAAPMDHYPTTPHIGGGDHTLGEFGGKAGLDALVNDAMARWLVNPRTRPYFENADQERIKHLLAEQFCVVLNGPCTYTGRSMAEAHRGLNVTQGAFYALVEELQIAMNQRHIPFAAQNRLLAALAPMHRDVITK
jgi:hemoglobin